MFGVTCSGAENDFRSCTRIQAGQCEGTIAIRCATTDCNSISTTSPSPYTTLEPVSTVPPQISVLTPQVTDLTNSAGEPVIRPTEGSNISPLTIRYLISGLAVLIAIPVILLMVILLLVACHRKSQKARKTEKGDNLRLTELLEHQQQTDTPEAQPSKDTDAIYESITSQHQDTLQTNIEYSSNPAYVVTTECSSNPAYAANTEYNSHVINNPAYAEVSGTNRAYAVSQTDEDCSCTANPAYSSCTQTCPDTRPADEAQEYEEIPDSIVQLPLN